MSVVRTCSLCKWPVPYTTAKASREFETNKLLTQLQFSVVKHFNYNTAWFKKMDSNSYVYISWTIHGMWMIYVTFQRGGPKFSNIAARMLKRRWNARCTAVADSDVMNSRTQKILCCICSQLTLLHGFALGERSSGVQVLNPKSENMRIKHIRQEFVIFLIMAITANITWGENHS
jgi:hypothetical protein